MTIRMDYDNDEAGVNGYGVPIEVYKALRACLKDFTDTLGDEPDTCIGITHDVIGGILEDLLKRQGDEGTSKAIALTADERNCLLLLLNASLCSIAGSDGGATQSLTDRLRYLDRVGNRISSSDAAQGFACAGS